MKFRHCLHLALLAWAVPAAASSDRAWQAFDVEVTSRCVAASGLRNARPSTIVGFDDRAGVVAMLVSDRTRGSSRARLCLYDKRRRLARIDDADGWSAPPHQQR